jgi:hypothetical protein
VESSGTVFEAKFMLSWSFSEEAAAEKYMPQLRHNMWVVAAGTSVLSVITGGGKWVEIKIHADPLYQQCRANPNHQGHASREGIWIKRVPSECDVSRSTFDTEKSWPQNKLELVDAVVCGKRGCSGASIFFHNTRRKRCD